MTKELTPKTKRQILIIAGLVLAVALLITLAFVLKPGKKSETPVDTTVGTTQSERPLLETTTAAETEETTASSAPFVTEAPVPVSIPVDFNAMQAVNPEVIGWIKVPGTHADYPILLDNTDENFYLNHDYDKSYAKIGSIFMQHYNKTDFTDFNTVIYGHNWENETMFSELHKFEDAEFFAANRFFYIYLPDRRLTYRIFSAYTSDNLHQILNFDYSTPALRQSYINRIFAHHYANFDREAMPTVYDRIVTLSTCTYSSDYRYLVQGVLVADEPAAK